MTSQVAASQWPKGVVFSAAASIIGAASKLCIRKSYTLLDQPTNGRHNCMTYVESWILRVVGVFGMTTLNPYCCVVALNYASPSLLAPFSGLTLVFIVVLSECTIGERPTFAQVLAAGLIIVGQIIIAIFGDHTNTSTLDMDDVVQEYTEPEFISYMIGMIGWVAMLGALILFGDLADRRFAWGVIGGSVTGIQPFIKDALAVLNGLQANKVLIQEYPHGVYVLLVCAGIIPFVGLVLLMECMKRYEATYSSSMFIGSMILSVSVMSAVRYHTFDHLDSMRDGALYVLGLSVLLSGTVVLACEDTMQTEIEESHSDTETEKKLALNSSYHTYGTIELSDDQMSYSSISSTSTVDV